MPQPTQIKDLKTKTAPHDEDEDSLALTGLFRADLPPLKSPCPDEPNPVLNEAPAGLRPHIPTVSVHRIALNGGFSETENQTALFSAPYCVVSESR